MRAVQRRPQLERGAALLLDRGFQDSVEAEVSDHPCDHQEREEDHNGAAQWFHVNLRCQYAHAHGMRPECCLPTCVTSACPVRGRTWTRTVLEPGALDERRLGRQDGER